MNSRIIKKINKLIKNGGLTLVELLVVIGIFLMITTIVIFNYSDFSSTVSLQNLTDDIALSIRKAQSFAIGARGISTGSDIVFNKSYGMHFSANENPENSLSGSNRSFLMFSTLGTSKKYTNNSYSGDICGQDNDCIELFNITTVDEIEKIEAYNGPTLVSSGAPSSSIDIIFTRPDPKAYLCYREQMTDDCTSNVSSVSIVISNGKTDDKKKIKTISVQNTGQISVQ